MSKVVRRDQDESAYKQGSKGFKQKQMAGSVKKTKTDMSEQFEETKPVVEYFNKQTDISIRSTNVK